MNNDSSVRYATGPAIPGRNGCDDRPNEMPGKIDAQFKPRLQTARMSRDSSVR